MPLRHTLSSALFRLQQEILYVCVCVLVLECVAQQVYVPHVAQRCCMIKPATFHYSCRLTNNVPQMSGLSLFNLTMAQERQGGYWWTKNI